MRINVIRVKLNEQSMNRLKGNDYSLSTTLTATTTAKKTFLLINDNIKNKKNNSKGPFLVVAGLDLELITLSLR